MIKELVLSACMLTVGVSAAEGEPFAEPSSALIETPELVLEKIDEAEEFSEEKEISSIEMETSVEAEDLAELSAAEMDEMIEENRITAAPEPDSALDHLADLTQEEPQTYTEAPEAQPTPYDTLLITPSEKQKIGQLLSTMANNSVFKLLFEKKRLERLGHDVNNVHPIRFIGTVFSDPRLVYCMRRIKSSGFKWDGFIDGFSQRFRKEIREGNIDVYLPSFAEALNVSLQDVQAYVNYKDFEGLVIYLMEKKR